MPWTTENVDICGSENACKRGEPRFKTRQKVRYDQEYLYVAAELEVKP